jgi:hypothetical protein
MTDIEHVHRIAQVMLERLDRLSRVPEEPIGEDEAAIALISDPTQIYRSEQFRQVVMQGRSVRVHVGVPASGLEILTTAEVGYSLRDDFSDPIALLLREAQGPKVGMVGCFAVSGGHDQPSRFTDLRGRDLVTARWLSDDIGRRRAARQGEQE